MSNWVYPAAQEITGATKIKDADNKIQSAMNDLVNWANNTGSYSPNLGASFNYTTVNAMTDVLLTSVTSGDGLRWNGTDFVNTPIYNRSEQDARYVQLSGNQTIAGVKTFSNGIVSSVTGNVTGNASTATTLQTARTISLTGDVSGSVSFNGSANVSITATVADNSHNHNTLTGLTASIAELNYTDGVTSNIQTQINSANSSISSLSTSKANLSSPALTGVPTSPTATLGTNTTQIATTAFAKAKSEADSIGVNQTWQNLTSSRVLGTTYTNNTGKPIMVSISVYNYFTAVTLIVGGIRVGKSKDRDFGGEGQVSAIVPTSSSYYLEATEGTSGILYWAELR